MAAVSQGRLAGKAALVTGGAVGIGRAIVQRFAAEGAQVLLGDVDAANGQALADALAAEGHSVLFVAMDVTSEASVQASVAYAVASFGKLDVLVNNAGGSSLHDRSVVEVAVEEFWRAIQIDLFGMFLCCRHAIPAMTAVGGGSIVNMGSIAARRGLVGRDAYTAAKGGVTALSRSIAVEFAPQRIRSNLIAPGAVLSDRMERFIRDDPRVRDAVSKHLLGLPQPGEVASLALYLASDESAHMTAAEIALDGGRSAVA
jgi:NAD(P)-dependent dehydrogenase (short-subunit alcohol dehydrogenase family)